MAQIPDEVTSLSDYLGRHVDTEQEALDAYEELIEGRPQDIVSYLVGLILADEKRHHEVFLSMRNSLESSIGWRSIAPTLPSPRVSTERIAELQQTTSQLLEIEKEDARELRLLRRKWSRSRGERQLWAMLVKTAELDTRKHILILRYLRSLMRDAERGHDG